MDGDGAAIEGSAGSKKGEGKGATCARSSPLTQNIEQVVGQVEGRGTTGCERGRGRGSL